MNHRLGVQESSGGRRAHPVTSGAFTLIELLVVIGVIGILASLLLPALSKAKDRARTITCINNLQQLDICWHMYAHDNDDVMPPNNYVQSIYTTTTNWGSPPSEDEMSWCRNYARKDTNAITESVSLLFIYNRNPAIYHCPSDRSTVDGRPDLIRNRSYNMGNSINCKDEEEHYRFLSEVKRPSTLFVFIDTDADAIWDSTFGVIPLGDPYQNFWLDIPADRHQRSAIVSFVDGHIEKWKWKAPKGGSSAFVHTRSADDLADLRVVQQYIKGANGN
jgi:prepilin-type N-terminal cleavage/methylation domain-containing protein/prepilin-type processing-associated H-X9-DG protein